MTAFEYKVIPAPRKGRKGKGVKGVEARFAYGIQELMNEMASQDWEFLRAETLPSDERHGLASAHTVYRDVLVFRRARAPGQDRVHADAIDQMAPDQANAHTDPQTETHIAEESAFTADLASDGPDSGTDTGAHTEPDTRPGMAHHSASASAPSDETGRA